MAKKEPTPKEAIATANLRKAERQTIALMQKRIKDISAQFLGEVDAILGDPKWKSAPVDLANVEAQRLFIGKLAKEMDAALLKLEGVAADSGNAIASAQSGGLVQRWDKEYAEEYLSRVHPKNGPSLAAVYTHSMAANAVATLRSVVVDTFATAAVAGMSARARAKLMQTAWAARCQDDNPCRFVDKAGRRWENARYVQMLVRTTAQRIETAAFCDSMTDDGFPLARISNDSDMDCEVCAAWEGRLIDLSHGNQLKKYGAVPLQAAREVGVFHPNCTHRLEYVSITEYPEEMLKDPEIGPKIGEARAFGKHNTRENAAAPTNTETDKHVKQVEKAAERRVDDADFQDKLKYTLDHLNETGRRLGGSTGAYLVTVDGKQFVVKGGASEAHLLSEMATDRLYKAAGVDVPGFIEAKDSSGKLYKVADFIEGKELSAWWSKASVDERAEMSRKLAAGMDVDAMVGNWDVIGMSGDNILVDKAGNPWRIDNGGSLSFRAQGGKKDASAWGEGWTDDFFTVPKNSNNEKYVGGVSASKLFRQAGARDWDEILEGLPEDEKKVMQMRVKEAKEQAIRAEDLKSGGYTDEYSDMVLKAANDLCRTGYREAVPKKIEYGKYGNCRPEKKAMSSINSGMPDYGSLALAAAKTVNYHANDGAYNKATLNAFFVKKPELEAIVKDDPSNTAAKYYLAVIDNIKAAVANKQAIGYVDTSPIVKKKRETKDPPKQEVSLTERLIDYVGQKDWDDYVYQWTDSQAGDSWFDDAIKRKVVEFHAMGLDVKTLDNPPPGVWNGITRDGGSWRNESYKGIRSGMNDATIARFTEIDAKVKAGTMLLLENADFVGNQRDKRRVMLFRTEREKDVFPGNKLTKGKRCDYNTSPAESFSFDHTVYVHSDCAVLCPTPYSRINAVHFLDRDKSGQSMFLGNGEREMNVNAIGIPRIFVSRGRRDHTMESILRDKTIIKAIEALDLNKK